MLAPVYALFRVQLGKMLNPAAQEGDLLFPYLRNTDVQWDRINVDDLPLMNFSAVERKKFELVAGDVLVCEGGEVGRAAIWNQQIENCYYQKALHRVRPLRGSKGRYFYYLLVAAVHCGAFESGNKSTIAHLTAEGLRQTRLPFPSVEIQAEVCRFLDQKTAAIDALIAKKERLIELLQEKRQALITQAVTKGLDPKVPMKDSGIPTVGQVPRHWKVQRAKTLFAERNERSTTGDEELLTVSHLTGVTPRSEKEVYMFQAETHVGYKVCHPGDLAVNTMWAWMGALGAVPKLGIISYSYHCYRQTCQELLPEYFDKLFRTPAYVCEITRHSKGVWTSRLRLYPEAMLGLLVLVPPMEEQEAILSFIDSSLEQDNSLENLCLESVSKLREYRQALISAAVTGQLDISQEVAKEVEEEVH